MGSAAMRACCREAGVLSKMSDESVGKVFESGFAVAESDVTNKNSTDQAIKPDAPCHEL